MSLAVEVIDFVHSIGMEKPVYEITIEDPKTGGKIGGLSAVTGTLRFKGKNTDHASIIARPLVAVDIPNGRWDFDFQAADFNTPNHQKGVAYLYLKGVHGGKAWGSKLPLVIRIKELWEL